MTGNVSGTATAILSSSVNVSLSATTVVFPFPSMSEKLTVVSAHSLLIIEMMESGDANDSGEKEPSSYFKGVLLVEKGDTQK